MPSGGFADSTILCPPADLQSGGFHGSGGPGPMRSPRDHVASQVKALTTGADPYPCFPINRCDQRQRAAERHVGGLPRRRRAPPGSARGASGWAGCATYAEEAARTKAQVDTWRIVTLPCPGALRSRSRSMGRPRSSSLTHPDAAFPAAGASFCEPGPSRRWSRRTYPPSYPTPRRPSSPHPGGRGLDRDEVAVLDGADVLPARGVDDAVGDVELHRPRNGLRWPHRLRVQLLEPRHRARRNPDPRAPIRPRRRETGPPRSAGMCEHVPLVTVLPGGAPGRAGGIRPCAEPVVRSPVPPLPRLSRFDRFPS